jgi:hypothetical protein
MTAHRKPTRSLRGLSARNWAFVCLALGGLLVPPTVTPCPVRAGLTSSRAASCCATKVEEAAPAKPPLRACCARKAAAAAQEAAPACKMQGTCCCKARPATSQAVVLSVSRPHELEIAVSILDPGVAEPELRGLSAALAPPARPGGSLHRHQLLCSWQI